MLLLGRSGVGKSYSGLVYCLTLLKKKWFSPERVLLISKTWKSDPSQKPLVDYCTKNHKDWDKTNAFEDIDTELLRTLFIA
jgi:hypothetical protein